MSDNKLFINAFPYQKDILALPVSDLDIAAKWYGDGFGLREIERREKPVPTIILEREGTKIGFAINGGDPGQDGAAILVSDIDRAKAELVKGGVAVGDIQVDERDGEKYSAFFVVAPDGLCYYFHQLISKS